MRNRRRKRLENPIPAGESRVWRRVSRSHHKKSNRVLEERSRKALLDAVALRHVSVRRVASDSLRVISQKGIQRGTQAWKRASRVRSAQRYSPAQQQIPMTQQPVTSTAGAVLVFGEAAFFVNAANMWPMQDAMLQHNSQAEATAHHSSI